MGNLENKRRKILVILIGVLIFIFSFNTKEIFAQREFISDWYIQNFDTTITLNEDSSLDVVERITADCDNLAGKHGIFRILPEEINIEGKGKIKTPVTLLSITDFSDNPYKYETIHENNTITWKIGDPDKTVQGLNNYLIHYRVGNVIRFDDSSFDEFYWNLLGNFWDLEIDNFYATLILPEGASKENTTIDYYTGYLGSKDKSLARYSWLSQNVLEFHSTQPLLKQQGITVSLIFPKGIFTPYRFSFFELYGKYIYFLILLIPLSICFFAWKKYGKNPFLKKSIIPIYEPPADLTPLEMGVLMKGGNGVEAEFITAEIINLAVKGLITIKETEKKSMFGHLKDYLLVRKYNEEIEKNLTPSQKLILRKIFSNGDEITLSFLKNKKIFKYLSDINNETKNLLIQKELITKKVINLNNIFKLVGFILAFFSFLAIKISLYFFLSIFFSGAIFLIFSSFLKPYTLKGAELNWQIKGFKLFMKTVDKDRAKFYEKENIFEKFLPYAIVFDITDIWIKRMKDIYGEEYFTHYSPTWYSAALAGSAFSIDEFSSNIKTISSAITRSSSSSFTGSGGSGGVGRGSGGGGGGGW